MARKSNMSVGSGAGTSNGGSRNQSKFDELKEALMSGFKSTSERLDSMNTHLNKNERLDGIDARLKKMEEDKDKKPKRLFESYFEATNSEGFREAVKVSKVAQSMAYLHMHQGRHLAIAEGVVDAIGRIGRKKDTGLDHS